MSAEEIEKQVAGATDEWAGGKDVESNWFKFTEVGDTIKGTLMSKRFVKSNAPTMPDQWVYEIKKEDGAVYNVGISVKKPGTVQRLNNCQLGDIIGIRFTHELEPTTKGFAKTKVLAVKTFGRDESFDKYPGEEEEMEPSVDNIAM